MAELENDTNVNIPEGDDTKTRKTVRLKPSVATPTTIKLPPVGGSVPLADPLTGRDTDTGNLEVLADTQTRRTVKLKPIAPQPPRPAPQPIAIEPGAAAPGAAAPVGDGANTQTRRTVVLRPSVAPASAINVDGQNTQTRKTVVLRPTAVPASVPVEPGAAPAPAADDMNSDTIKVSRPIRPAIKPAPAAAPVAPAGDSKQTVMLEPGALQPGAPADDMNSDTIKVGRVKPETPGKPVLNLNKNTVALDPSALSDAPAAPPTSNVDGDATIRIQRPVRKPMVPPKPVASKATMELKKEEAPAAPPQENKAPSQVKEAPVQEQKGPSLAKETPVQEKKVPSLTKEEEIGFAGQKPMQEGGAVTEGAVTEGAGEMETSEAGEVVGNETVTARPSVLYTILAAVTLLMVAATAVISTVQYLNLYQGTEITLPGLPTYKN